MRISKAGGGAAERWGTNDPKPPQPVQYTDDPLALVLPEWMTPSDTGILGPGDFHWQDTPQQRSERALRAAKTRAADKGRVRWNY